MEDELEYLSAACTGGVEHLLEHWSTNGAYGCARCRHIVYNPSAKWRGPCPWPSFREAVSENAIYTRPVPGYNGYKCAVYEVYCAKCRLFFGHKFEDAIEKGDTSPNARWRH
eukprot:g5472.t1